METSFAGRPAPACEQFDACGAAGTVSLTPMRVHGALVVRESRTVRRPVGSKRALRDLSAGRLRLDYAYLTASNLPVSTVETLSRPDGSNCHDRVEGATLSFSTDPSRDGFVVALGDLPFAASFSDPFRTHCPGPSESEVLGTGGLASRTLGLRTVTSRHFRLTLRGAPRLADPSYTGRPTGAVSLDFRRARVDAGTHREAQ